MIFRTTGHAGNGLWVTGFPWSPAYLVDGTVPLLFEAGFFCMGPVYERDVRRIVGSRAIPYLFLTHVHYDHCGAAAYMKRAFPGMKICASARAREIMMRPNAVDLMKSLSRYVVPLVSAAEGVDETLLNRQPFEPFEVDKVLSDGDEIEAGDDLHIRVIATPGHTRDLISFYIVERKVLVATESVGIMAQTGDIMSEFLVDYDAYLLSLRKLASLDIEVLCQGHHFVFTGTDVRQFLERSLKATEVFRNHVENLLAVPGRSVDDVVQMIKSEEYDPNPGPKQPEKAYLLNLRTRIQHLADRGAKNVS